MTTTMSIEELRTLTADTIERLRQPTMIKAGDRTVGLLVPYPKVTREALAQLSAEVDAAVAERTPDETARLAALVDDR